MMDNKDNAVLGAQRIYLKENAWEKKMLYGQRSKGAVLKLGSPKVRERILCEGYATGLSIGMAVSQLQILMGVVVCFSAYNMIEVAKDTPGRVMVFADNDRSGAGQQAAEATGCPWIMADNEGFDANDLHKIYGLGEVRKKIIQLRQL
jgi:putative DNA primase/helicase